MQATIRERGRLFVRPETPRPVAIRERHLAILANIARFGLANAAQLAALDGGSEQNVTRELLALWENEYVERLLGQNITRHLYKGSFPTAYGLTRKGAALLRKHGLEVRRRLLDGIDKSRTAGWRFIEHKIEITGFMTALELAIRSRSNLGLLYRSDILEDAPKARRDRRVRLTANVQLDGIHRALSVDPDELFGLRFLDAEEETYFMFERDRGEMPIERHRNTHQTHFAKKMAIYLAANRQGVHSRELGIPHFRVATVTTTRARVKQMIEALQRLTDGRGSQMFLFVDEARLADGTPLEVMWTTGKGTPLRLAD